MEPVAENRFAITKSLFFEGMHRVLRETLGGFIKKALLGLAGLWAVLAAAVLFTQGSPFVLLAELVILGAVAVWLCVFLPRSRAKRAWQAMESKSGGNLTRVTRFYQDHLEIESGAGKTSIAYENVDKVLTSTHLLVLVTKDKTGVMASLDGFTKGGAEEVRALLKQEKP